MISIDKQFELEIPTHIAFTLYKNDYIDNLIISKVKKECRNRSENPSEFNISLEQFERAIKTSAFLRAELQKTIDQELLPNPNFKPNSIFFLQSIIARLSNLERITFKISNEKIFSRLVKLENGHEIVSFHFNILEGIFDLTQILDRKQLDTFNKKFIDIGILSNKYLDRASHFYIKAALLFDILAEMEESQIMDAFDIITSIDPKIEEDDPILLVKTDYTPY
jgi:hypothetical protein|tara:strand:- start:13 stop:681 length:669 start_codon:yes stop_codon:yes gene_type:complete